MKTKKLIVPSKLITFLLVAASIKMLGIDFSGLCGIALVCELEGCWALGDLWRVGPTPG